MNMEHFFEVTLSLISQFTGHRGGIEFGIVHFGIAGMLWFVLFLFAWFNRSHSEQSHETLLLWGFGLGFARELFMMSMVSSQAYGLINADFLHIVFPPLEHVLFDIAMVVIAAAYMQYLVKNYLFCRRYLKIGIVLVLLCYLATFWWWSKYIIANPESKFGQTWCDWLFRINASVLLLVPMVVLYKRTRGWVQNAIFLALFFIFLNQFLKISDMALGEVYETTFTPIRHGFYLLGVFVFGYVYVRELFEERNHATDELKKAHATLEQKVKERTVELERKIEEVKVLSGFLPICASCKKIRDDEGYWNQIESYIAAHSEAEFSHGICPDCARKLYPELDL